jgi:hypothetical protein
MMNPTTNNTATTLSNSLLLFEEDAWIDDLSPLDVARESQSLDDVLELLQHAQNVVSATQAPTFDGFDLDIEPTPIGPGAIVEPTPQFVPSSFSSRFYQSNTLPVKGVSSLFQSCPQLSGSSPIPEQVASHATNQAETIQAKQRSRKFQTGQWNERFQELLEFRTKHGHLFVPHHFPENQQLAQWVKRQRYQYKLKHLMGKHSTLSDDREQALQKVGFIWDSHAACWQERFEALKVFSLLHGHCNVPHNYHDPSLSIWCKHQRRQWKRQQKGQSSTMNNERYHRLNAIGFDWNPRNLKV